MARVPSFQLDAGSLVLSEPPHDASDPNLSPSHVRFSTRFRGMGCLRQVVSFPDDLTDITAFPLEDAPWIAPPTGVLALDVPANAFGANGSDTSPSIMMGSQVTVQSSRGGTFPVGTLNLITSYAVALADQSNIYVDPFYRRVGEGLYSMPAVSRYGGWVYVFECPSAAQSGPGTGIYFGAEPGIPALRIARNDADPREAVGADVYYSSDKELGVVAQEGAVDTIQGNVDISIPDMGFKPAVFFLTAMGTPGMIRHIDNTTIRFYQRAASGSQPVDYSYYAVYATPMPGLA